MNREKRCILCNQFIFAIHSIHHSTANPSMPKPNSGLRPGTSVHVHSRFFKNITSNQFQTAFGGQDRPALGVVVSEVRDGVFMVKFNNRIEVELKQTILKLLPNGRDNAPLPVAEASVRPRLQPSPETDDMQVSSCSRVPVFLQLPTLCHCRHIATRNVALIHSQTHLYICN